MNDFSEQKESLIRHYIRNGYVKDELAINAFRQVPRELFLPENMVSSAYSDHPLPLMNTGQTISAPHMTVMILEYLDLKPGMKILEIGAGSGYQAALIAAIVCSDTSKKGSVYSIEIVPDLVPFARKNLEKAGYQNCVTVIEGDGTLGWEKEAPYDRIIITAAGPKVPPPLLEQLALNGTLVIPLGRPYIFQRMTRFRKITETDIEEEYLSSVAFVPLRGKHGI
ncbi:MAG: protein-L-isoaspartate(D-aspartate) O-methyltransferase [Candidatus Heimdallarchaeota archaeon]|nr:protein-L-isoaspartate(D-aspartate) O-methyltransferase [Candidatus Heimdallarchaeota archaeon]